MSATRPGVLLRHLHPADPDDGPLLARFADRRDPAAFAALVRRHGPMVYAVCRRVTGHAEDAEDAFQAAFLVLARSAGTVRDPARLGSWLYGVAVKVAGRARRTAARRRRRETTVAAFPDIPGADPTPTPDIGPALHEELAALPAHHRDPIVLCDLQGLSRADAAKALGVPEGTVSSRLANGRKKLAERLTRRGVALSVAAIPVALAEGRGAVPEALFSNTCGLVAAWAGGGAVPAAVVRLARGGLSMKSVLLGGFLSFSLAAGAVLAAAGGDPPTPPADPPRPPDVTAVVAVQDAKAQPGAKKDGAKLRAPRLDRMEDLGIRLARVVAWSPNGDFLAVSGVVGDAVPGGLGGGATGAIAKGAAGGGAVNPFGGAGGAGGLAGPNGIAGRLGKSTLALVWMKDRRVPAAYATLPASSRLIGFAPDGTHLYTETHESGLISGAHTVQRWEASVGPNGPGGVESLGFTPSRVFEVNPDSALFTPTLDGHAIRYLVREVDKAGIRKVEVRQYDMRNGEDSSLGKFGGTFRTTQFTPDAKRVVAVNDEGAVEVYSADDAKRAWAGALPGKEPEVVLRRSLERDSTFVAVARDGSRMLAIRGRSAPVVMDGATGKASAPLDGIDLFEMSGTSPSHTAVSADGRLAALVYTTLDKYDAKNDPFGGGGPKGAIGPITHERGATRLTVWDTATGKVVRSWTGGSPLAITFHPTRPVLAILEANGTETRLGLWEFPLGD